MNRLPELPDRSGTHYSVEGPYKHGNSYRCRIRTASGRRWCASAVTIEAALRLAEEAVGQPVEPVGSRVPNQDPKKGGPGCSFPDSSPSAGSRLKRADDQKRRPESRNRATEELAQPSGSPVSIPGMLDMTLTTPDGARISGPYPHRGGYRCGFTPSGGERQWTGTAATAAGALKLAERAAAKHAKEGATTVQAALDTYLQYKEKVGVRPATLVNTRNAVRALFRGATDSPLCKITQRVCQQQYDLLREAVDPRTGRTPTVATHRSYLIISRTFMRWVVERGWLKENPLLQIRGIGKRKRGKAQLTFDETGKLIETCVGLAVRGDDGATAVLMAASTGLRSSEILSRTVRDLDHGGTYIRVVGNDGLDFETKTESSGRPVKLHPVLQPILAERVRGKLATDPLFLGEGGQGRRRRQWLHAQVARLCELAGVPKVCTHSLRGALATAYAAAGVPPDRIADLLGHSSSQVTLKHYILPGVAENAQRDLALSSLLQQRPQQLPA